MNEKLAQALAPLLRDIESTAGLVVRLDETPWTSWPKESPSATLWLQGSGGTGFQVDPYASLSERILRVQDYLQQAVIEARTEAGLPGNWPRCPDHPTKHPLRLNTDAWPAWCCPWAEEGVIVAAVGALPAEQDSTVPDGRGRRRYVDRQARAR